MRTPSKLECFQLMLQMAMMDHIAAHSLMVCRVGLFLADHLDQQGVPVDRNLVASAAMLHDITKSRSLTTGENHAETGGMFLRNLGFSEVGHIIEQHVVLDDYSASRFPTETEIVNYADKRVLNDKVVSLAVRMDYILNRYGQTRALEKKLRWIWEKSVDLEEKIFAFIPFTPEGLKTHTDLTKFDADYAGYLRYKGNAGQASGHPE